MRDINRVIYKVFVKEFYRLNATFFILIITLAFGFMSGAEHRALAEFFISSKTLTMIPVAIWVVYLLKIVVFNRHRLKLSDNEFIFQVTLLEKTEQFRALFAALSLQFLPAIGYAIFLIAMAAKQGSLEIILLLIFTVLVLLSAFSLVFQYLLAHRTYEARTNFIKRIIDRYAHRPISWIYFSTIIRQEPFLFIGTKVFNGLLLFAVMSLYNYDTFDGRLLAMAASLAAAANFTIFQQVHLVDQRYLPFLKNLPVALSRRWLWIFIAINMVVIPEIVMILKYGPQLPALASLSILTLLPAFGMTLYSIVYLQFKNQENLPRLIFAFALAHIILILCHVPVILVVAFDVIFSFTVFSKRYYFFEMPETQ